MIDSNSKEKFYFEIRKNQFNNLFYFDLKDEEGYCLVSDYYTQKTNCLKGINSVKINSTKEERFEVKEFSNGQFNVYLRAGNGKIIAQSTNYLDTYEEVVTMIEDLEYLSLETPVIDYTKLKLKP